MVLFDAFLPGMLHRFKRILTGSALSSVQIRPVHLALSRHRTTSVSEEQAFVVERSMAWTCGLAAKVWFERGPSRGFNQEFQDRNPNPGCFNTAGACAEQHSQHA